MIHSEGPENQKGPPGGDGGKPEKSDPPSHVQIEWVDEGKLSPPPRNPAGSRLKKLFDTPTPEAISEISDILWASDRAPVLSYLGYRLAQAMSPAMAPLACEAIQRKSLACTSDLLVGLAQREYASLTFGCPPIVAGPEFANFRRLIADLAVSPDCHFLEEDWVERNREILTLTTYPITILRRSAGPEVDHVLLNAASYGGIDPSMNRRALELLNFRESSDAVTRILPAPRMVHLAKASNSVLRDAFNRAQLFAVLDLWASKPEKSPSPGESGVRDQLLRQWTEFKDSKDAIHAEDNPRILEVLRLLRHFSDPASGLVLREALDHPHAGIRIIAGLSLDETRERALSDLRSCLMPEAEIGDTLSALRVFGYHISSEVDARLYGILDEYVQRVWSVDPENARHDNSALAQKVILLQGMLRRFFTERSESPFLRPIIASVGSENDAMANVAINTFIQVTKMDRIPPPHFYDCSHALLSLRNSLGILGQAAERDDAKETREMVSALEELFVMRGPAAYGFELVAEDSASDEAPQG